MNPLKSEIQGIGWPALNRPRGAQLLSVLYQLDKSQWFTPGKLQKMQFEQLENLIAHANRTVPFYRNRYQMDERDFINQITPENWNQIPILKRQDIQEAGHDLKSTGISKQHGKLGVIQTSGSTARPIKTFTTEVTRLFWAAFTLREHIWHNRDFMRKVAVIRPDRRRATPQGNEFSNWGSPVNEVFKSGPAAILSSSVPIEDQVRWLKKQAPVYLLSLPSNILGLTEVFMEQNETLKGLRQVLTFGETVKPETRKACKSAWGVDIVDMYSAQEVGYMALQCPEHGRYHIQSENALVEILDKNGNACKPGEIGKVVVTTLHNFATPLIRYEIKDYARVGDPCPCGRGLPVLERIIGRERNLATLPDGSRFWPSFPAEDWADIAPIRQIQMIQKTTREEEELTKVLHASLGHPFNFTFTYLEHIPKGKNGKYEDFISRIVRL